MRAFVVLLHQDDFQTPPAPGPFPAAPNSNAYTDVDRCVGFAGPEVTAIAQGLDPQVDVIVSAHTHAPSICPDFAGTGKLVTSASSFGRVITDIDLLIDHQTAVGYRVTTNSFLASGGDGFTVFNQCTDALGGEIDLDALVRYFQQFGDGNPPPEPVPAGPQNRITRIG